MKVKYEFRFFKLAKKKLFYLAKVNIFFFFCRVPLFAFRRFFRKKTMIKMPNKTMKRFVCEMAIIIVAIIMYIFFGLLSILVDLTMFSSFLLVLTKAAFQILTSLIQCTFSKKNFCICLCKKDLFLDLVFFIIYVLLNFLNVLPLFLTQMNHKIFLSKI